MSSIMDSIPDKEKEQLEAAWLADPVNAAAQAAHMDKVRKMMEGVPFGTPVHIGRCSPVLEYLINVAASRCSIKH